MIFVSVHLFRSFLKFFTNTFIIFSIKISYSFCQVYSSALHSFQANSILKILYVTINTKMHFIMVRCFVSSNIINLLPNSSNKSICPFGFSTYTSSSSKNDRLDSHSYGLFLILALRHCVEPQYAEEKWQTQASLPRSQVSKGMLSFLAY